MSIYSDISKSIGLTPKHVEVPSVEKANILLADVKKGDKNAFYEVFNVYRHAKNTDNANEAMDIIIEAFKVGSSNTDWRK